MTRVAIIGAGPCGLSQLRAFEQAKRNGVSIPEVVCFEKQDDWGGLWNYTWRTGLDAHGEPVHGSMYRYLWSNGPKECLEFADYSFEEHFRKAIPSFPPREVLYDYIIGRATASNLKPWIRFNTAVKYVQQKGDKFLVSVMDYEKDSEYAEAFDYVIVCSGHFSVPNVPEFEGIKTFPGRVLHSHDFREAREFTGRNLLIIGGSYSAEDIALQSHKYGAASVTISYRSSPMGFHWPAGVKEVPLLMKLDGSTAHFKDGSTQDVDAIVLCTGYLHHFPFLEDQLKLKTHNRLYPDNIYKGIFWKTNPRLMYIGMQDQFYTFSMFDLQAWYARDFVLGRINRPSQSEMEQDIAHWLAREEALADPLQQIDFQTDYMKDLHQLVDYPKFDIDAAAQMFKQWEHHKEESITGYRNKAFKSTVTGNESPLHHTEWLEAMDDSMADFLRV